MPEEYDRLIEGNRLIHSDYESNPLVAPSDFDRVIEGYLLTQTALLGDPCCTTAVQGRM